MNNWNYQFDMAHAFTTHFLLSYFYTTTVTYNSLVPDSLIFSTSTLIVLNRTENLFTEKTISLWLIGSVVYCLWLEHLSI
jgi:hypothetical protein